MKTPDETRTLAPVQWVSLGLAVFVASRIVFWAMVWVTLRLGWFGV